MDVEGIIPAAGYSSRAGTHKMILDIDGKTILERCIEGMYDACSKVIVVGGYKIENLSPICSKYSKVKLVLNREFPSGMFSSVKEGMKHIKAGKFFLTPGDYPFIKNQTYLSIAMSDEDITVPEFKGQRGHPVFINSRHIDEILNSAYYASLRDFLDTKEITFLSVTDPGILLDIDTMSDYENLLLSLRKVKLR